MDEDNGSPGSVRDPALAGAPNSNAAESPQHLAAKLCLCPAHPSTTDERQRNGTEATDVESGPLLLVWFGF